MLKDLARVQKPMIITQNGLAAGVLLDVESYEKNQEALALLKILAIGNTQIEKGMAIPVKKAFSAIRQHAKLAA